MASRAIRNFCIIAHIDHGKSTLADRLIEDTGTMTKREMKNTQVLDTMELEQERGITIKLQPVRMAWKLGKEARAELAASDNPNKDEILAQDEFILNLIDTPGHADFAYEVSRSLAACEGAILLVDASQGIEAQTLANVYAALEHGLHIIPVLNKIDLPAADPERTAKEIETVLGYPADTVSRVSGKTGLGVAALLDRICIEVPAPREL